MRLIPHAARLDYYSINLLARVDLAQVNHVSAWEASPPVHGSTFAASQRLAFVTLAGPAQLSDAAIEPTAGRSRAASDSVAGSVAGSVTGSAAGSVAGSEVDGRRVFASASLSFGVPGEVCRDAWLTTLLENQRKQPHCRRDAGSEEAS